MKNHCGTFKKQIESILEKHDLLVAFRQQSVFHHRFEREGFQPLVVERRDKFIMVTHYYEQNGDLIPDPDFELIVKEDGEWYPVAMQFATGHYLCSRFWENGKEFVVRHFEREQIEFSRMWARNLKWQDY